MLFCGDRLERFVSPFALQQLITQVLLDFHDLLKVSSAAVIVLWC